MRSEWKRIGGYLLMDDAGLLGQTCNDGGNRYTVTMVITSEKNVVTLRGTFKIGRT